MSFHYPGGKADKPAPSSQNDKPSETPQQARDGSKRGSNPNKSLGKQ